MDFVFSGIMLFLVAAPIWIGWRFFHRLKGGKTKDWLLREVIYISFFLYLLMLFSLTLLPLYFDGSQFERGSLHGNLIPILNTVNDIGRNPGSFFSNAFWLKNIVGNIVAFIPFGILFPTVFKKRGTFAGTVLFGFALTLAIEMLQLAFSYMGISCRIFDIDDILLNVMGACIGFLLRKGILLGMETLLSMKPFRGLLRISVKRR